MSRLRVVMLVLPALPALAGSCREPTRPRPIPAKLAIVQQPSSVTAGVPFTIRVEVHDVEGALATDAAVPIAIAFAGIGSGATRTLGGVREKVSAGGVAIFTDLTIDRAGAHSLIATTPDLTAMSTEPITVGAAAAVTRLIHAGDDQVTSPGGSVAVRPAVRVADAFDNGVPGVPVAFSVESGGGSITGADQVTGVDGVARIGSWTLGASGANSLTASVAGATAPLTFNARVSLTVISSITPALLSPGVVATITGSGFSATPGENALHIDATPATVTASTPTTITFTVPSNLACEPLHDAIVQVVSNGDPGSRGHPVRAARQRSLAAGEMLAITDPAEVRCNEFDASGSLYLVSVFNSQPVHNTLGAGWQLRGEPSAGTVATRAQDSAPQERRPVTYASPTVRFAQPEGDATHLRILEANLRDLERNATRLRNNFRMRSLRAAPARALAVGDMKTVRLPNVNANFCDDFIEINTRVAYAGTRAVILEDVTNQLYSQIDTTYAAIGQEFDNTMYNILLNNFGDPLAMDPATDNDGRLHMVFSREFNDRFAGLAGFVVSCDMFPRDVGNQTSNFGEYFYARVPTVSGSLGGSNNTPPNWSWSMRSTIIHEVKHITSFGERVKAGAQFELSWLEESSARLSEELFERANYAFTQRSNIGYGSSSDQRGPWCGVRGCSGKPRGIARIFEDLNLNWYRVSDSFSPLGRVSGSDFSFYNTAWSLLRWSIDHSTLPEADFIKALIKGPERGVSNLEARTGRNFRDMLPEWSMAMALDDYPGFVPANARLSQPSWNLRGIMEGLSTDFAQYQMWPFAPVSRAFGSFTVIGRTLPGTSAFVSVGGLMTSRQLFELKSDIEGAAAPELGIAFVRIQ